MDLEIQLARLQQSSGLTYRVMLGGLLAVHGRHQIVKELMAIFSDKAGWVLPG
jgi:hypothetical protein